MKDVHPKRRNRSLAEKYPSDPPQENPVLYCPRAPRDSGEHWIIGNPTNYQKSSNISSHLAKLLSFLISSSWSSIVVFTAHKINKRELRGKTEGAGNHVDKMKLPVYRQKKQRIAFLNIPVLHLMKVRLTGRKLETSSGSPFLYIGQMMAKCQ